LGRHNRKIRVCGVARIAPILKKDDEQADDPNIIVLPRAR
jgi:hypothetical protein